MANLCGKSNLTDDELINLQCNLGAVQGFLELLYGCHSSIGSDDITGNILYLITDAEDHLKQSLAILGINQEVTA